MSETENTEWKDTSTGDSPDRYRALYAFAALNLNYATGVWSLAQHLTEPSNSSLRDYLYRNVASGLLRDITPPRLDGVTALRHAAHGARELFLLSHQSITSPPTLRKRSSRFPRYFLTSRTTDALARRDITPFLSQEIRPSTMSLIAGVLQLRDQAGFPTADGTASPTKTAGFARFLAPFSFKSSSTGDPGDSADLADHEEPADSERDASKDGSPENVARALSNNEEPSRKGIIEWLDRNPDTGFRVRFNLACYESREILAVDDEHKSAQALDAFRQLDEALHDCPRTERSSLVNKARTDPALTALAAHNPQKFDSLLDSFSPTSDAELSTDNGSTSRPFDVMDLAIPETVIEDARLRDLVRAMLVRMHPPGEPRLPRTAFFDATTDNATDIERSLQELPHDDADIVRRLLARLLFLPHWPASETQ